MLCLRYARVTHGRPNTFTANVGARAVHLHGLQLIALVSGAQSDVGTDGYLWWDKSHVSACGDGEEGMSAKSPIFTAFHKRPPSVCSARLHLQTYYLLDVSDPGDAQNAGAESPWKGVPWSRCRRWPACNPLSSPVAPPSCAPGITLQQSGQAGVWSYNWPVWCNPGAWADDANALLMRVYLLPQSFDLKWPDYQIEGGACAVGGTSESGAARAGPRSESNDAASWGPPPPDRRRHPDDRAERGHRHGGSQPVRVWEEWLLAASS
jgi:hypothetical protein